MIHESFSPTLCLLMTGIFYCWTAIRCKSEMLCNIGYPSETNLNPKSCQISLIHNLFSIYPIFWNFAQSTAVILPCLFVFVSLLSHFWLIHLFYLHLLYQPYVGLCQATCVQSHQRQSTSAVAIATCEVQVSAADYQTVPTVATGVCSVQNFETISQLEWCHVVSQQWWCRIGETCLFSQHCACSLPGALVGTMMTTSQSPI